MVQKLETSVTRFPDSLHPDVISPTSHHFTIKPQKTCRISKMTIPALPFEIIHLIIDQFIPSSFIIALPQNHPSTRTLHALTLTSRAISQASGRLLLTHCLYIDSPSRLRSLLLRLNSDVTPPSGTLHSLYLAPFDHPLSDLPDPYGTINGIKKLLTIIASSLKRFILDMPLQHLAWNFQDVDKLKPVFDALLCVEVFCSLHDDIVPSFFTLSSNGEDSQLQSRGPIWSHWRSLRVLSLYGGEVNIGHQGYYSKPEFWNALAGLSSLQTVILTGGEIIVSNIETLWNQACESPRQLLFLRVDIEDGAPDWNFQSSKNSNVLIKHYPIPTSYYGDEDPTELCRDWIRRRMLRGEPVEGWD